VKWLIDNQLPHQLCTALKKRGHEAVHVSELLNAHRTKDEHIRRKADKEGYIVVSKDEDFLDSYRVENSPTRLVHVSTGNMRNRELIFLFMRFLDDICGCMDEGGLVELDRTRLIIR